jgi:hypothetical protein
MKTTENKILWPLSLNQKALIKKVGTFFLIFKKFERDRAQSYSAYEESFPIEKGNDRKFTDIHYRKSALI